MDGGLLVAEETFSEGREEIKPKVIIFEKSPSGVLPDIFLEEYKPTFVDFGAKGAGGFQGFLSEEVTPAEPLDSTVFACCLKYDEDSRLLVPPLLFSSPARKDGPEAPKKHSSICNCFTRLMYS